MPRYHVSEDGTPRPCKATKGACPLTDENGAALPHGSFDSPEEARIFAEAMNAQQHGGSFPTLAGKLDQASVPPLYSSERFPDLYPAAKPADESTVRDFYSSFESFNEEKGWELEISEYGSDYQEFKDSAGDHDGPDFELTVTTEVFNDSGKLESSFEDLSRINFTDESEREAAGRASMSAADYEELEKNSAIIREEWVSPNKRLTYRMTNY